MKETEQKVGTYPGKVTSLIINYSFLVLVIVMFIWTIINTVKTSSTQEVPYRGETLVASKRDQAIVKLVNKELKRVDSDSICKIELDFVYLSFRMSAREEELIASITINDLNRIYGNHFDIYDPSYFPMDFAFVKKSCIK